MDYHRDQYEDQGFLPNYYGALVHFIIFLIRRRKERMKNGETVTNRKILEDDVFYIISDLKQLKSVVKKIPFEGIILMREKEDFIAYFVEDGYLVAIAEKKVLRVKIPMPAKGKEILNKESGKIEYTDKNKNLLRWIKEYRDRLPDIDQEARCFNIKRREQLELIEHEKVLKNLISSFVPCKDVSCDEAILAFQIHLREKEGLIYEDDDQEDKEINTLIKSIEKTKIRKYRSRLFIGEAGLSYPKALLGKHSATKPGLAASFTVTEYMSYDEMKNVHPTTVETVSELQGFGATVIYE